MEGIPSYLSRRGNLRKVHPRASHRLVSSGWQGSNAAGTYWKRRHTAKRIWERLQDEGFTGGYTIVKDAVRELKRTSQEVFMPLTQPPGEAQVDFGHALVKMNGVLRKICFFVMALPYSDAFFIRAYERECTETFWDGHVRAFAFFGGVPRRITYDNSKIAIARIIGPRLRELTEGFLQVVSHYLFRYHFCLVRRANEKGLVEGTVKYGRLNFLVPVPEVQDFEELNAPLEQRCRADLQRRLRGKRQSKEKLLAEEQMRFLPLPFTAFEACRTRPGRVNSELLVRFDDNDYSVPMEYAYQDVVVKGDTDGIEQFLSGSQPWRQTTFPLGGGKHLRLVQIAQADVRQYGALLRCGEAR